PSPGPAPRTRPRGPPEMDHDSLALVTTALFVGYAWGRWVRRMAGPAREDAAYRRGRLDARTELAEAFLADDGDDPARPAATRPGRGAGAWPVGGSWRSASRPPGR